MSPFTTRTAPYCLSNARAGPGRIRCPTGRPISGRPSHWLGGCRRGSIDVLKARFSLYVVPTRTGKLVQALHEARSEDEVASVDAKVGRLV